MHWEPDTSRQVDELEGLNELVPLEQDHTRAKLVSSPTVPLLDSVCYSVVIGHDIRRAHRPNHSLPPCNVSSFSFEGAHRLASWPATTCPSLSVNKRPRALSRGNAFSYANPSTDRVVRTRSSSMDGQRNSCACRGSFAKCSPTRISDTMDTIQRRGKIYSFIQLRFIVHSWFKGLLTLSRMM